LKWEIHVVPALVIAKTVSQMNFEQFRAKILRYNIALINSIYSFKEQLKMQKIRPIRIYWLVTKKVKLQMENKIKLIPLNRIN
jgi:hypothetical protein